MRFHFSSISSLLLTNFLLIPFNLSPASGASPSLESKRMMTFEKIVTVSSNSKLQMAYVKSSTNRRQYKHVPPSSLPYSREQETLSYHLLKLLKKRPWDSERRFRARFRRGIESETLGWNGVFSPAGFREDKFTPPPITYGPKLPPTKHSLTGRNR